MNNPDKISQAGVNERAKLRKTLNRVSKTLKADSALKEATHKIAESNNTTFGNHTSSAAVPTVTQPEFNAILTDTILEIPIPYLESPQVTPKPDRGKGIARDTDEFPRKLMPSRLDKEEKIEQAAKEARLSKLELIKVVHEKAIKARVDPMILASAKGGQEFKKIHDTEIKVLNREHSKKIKKAKELRKKRIDQYRWTTNSRLKPETITDIHIHPNIMPVVITVYRGDRRNFDIYKPFKFGDFGVTKLDELDVFNDEAFQRMSDIYKVDVKTLFTYLVMASNNNTLANQRFCLALRSLIDSHLDKEKLKSKRVKIEVMGYSLN
ncbi:hypothetical protein Tco_0862774 [Tanacetum coccineum]